MEPLSEKDKNEVQKKDQNDEKQVDKEEDKEIIIENDPFKDIPKEKAFTPEEKVKIKVYLKEQTSEKSISLYESCGPNSYQSSGAPSLKKIRDSISEYDKIISGKDESRIYSNSIFEEKDSMKSDQEKDKASRNSSSGSLRKDFLFRRCTIRSEHKSIFKTIIEEKDKNVKLRDIVNAQMNELKDSSLTFFSQTMKELENRYIEYINNISDYIMDNENKISKVFHLDNDSNKDENMLEFTKTNILQQVENLIEIHDNIFDALEDHISLLGIFLEKSDLIQQKNPLEFFINTYSSDIINSWFLNKINFQKLNIRSFDANKDLSELYTKFLVKQKNNNFKNFTITQDINGKLSNGANYIQQNLKNIEKLKFNKVRSEEINKVFESNKKGDKKEENTASKLKALSLIQSDFSTITLNKLYTPSLKKLKIKRIILPLSLSGFFDSILFKSSFLQNIYWIF